MLVDLGRNDVGRVAEFGTVRLTAFMEIERYSHVMHLVSEVRGRLRPDLDAVAALAASFPAGTVSGPRSLGQCRSSMSSSRYAVDPMREP